MQRTPVGRSTWALERCRSKVLICAMLLLAAPRTAQAGVNVWTRNSLGTRGSLAFAIDPHTPTTLYTVMDGYFTGGGVFKSTDAGGTWSAANTGLPVGPIQVLAINPDTPTTLYAGTYYGGVYKSTDGGATWNAANAGLPNAPVYALAIDRLMPSTLYVSVYNGDAFGDADPGVFKSTDGGATWSAAKNGLPASYPIPALAIDPARPATLYAGTVDGVYKTTDGGASWNAASTGLPDPRSITVLAINPAMPSTLYAGGAGRVFKSTDGGATWGAASAGLTGPVISLAIDPFTPSMLYGGGGGRVFKSSDAGGTWNAAITGLPPGSIYALAIDPAMPSTLYVGTDFGVFKSSDAGGTWNAANTGLPPSYAGVSALAIDPTTPGTLYAWGDGLFKSTDGGAAWSLSYVASDQNIDVVGVTALAIDPLTPSTLYASTTVPGPSGGVYKSTDGGATWSAASVGLPNAPVSVLVIDPSTPRTLYAGTCNRGPLCFGGGVFKSTDAGTTWSVASLDPPGFHGVSALAIDPITPTTLYGAGLGGVFKSTDTGGAWTAVNTGLPNSDPFIFPVVVAIAIVPTMPTTLYAGTFNGGVFKSTDAGGTWGAASTGLPLGTDSSRLGISALVIDPVRPTTLYAGTTGDFTAGMGGVYKSTDDGSTWNAINSGLTDYGLVVYALAIDPHTPTTVYAVTVAGVFDIEQVPPVPCVGDCNDDQAVTIDELLTLVNIALGTAQPSACPHGNPTGTAVDVALIIQAVTSALDGCSTPPSTLCGNGVTEPGEDCDDGGSCIGGTNAGAPCTSEADCMGAGVCIGGEHAEASCTGAADCPGGTCVHCVPQGGDGCAANCTLESDVTFNLVPGVQEGVDITPGTSGAVIYSEVFQIPLPFTVSPRLTIGRERNGQIPVVIKAARGRPDRVAITPNTCFCRRAVAAKTCGGTIFEPDGVTRSLDCTPGFTAGDRVCQGKNPCAAVHGPGNSASGVIGCRGLDSVNVSLTQDSGDTSSVPRPPLLTLSGSGGAGSAVLFATTALGGRLFYRQCAGQDVSVYGPDGEFCTDDDPQGQRGTPVTAPVTTGVATGRLLNANQEDGNDFGPFSVTGHPFSCGLLAGGIASGGTLASVSVELDRETMGDIVTTSLLVGTPP